MYTDDDEIRPVFGGNAQRLDVWLSVSDSSCRLARRWNRRWHERRDAPWRLAHRYPTILGQRRRLCGR